MPVSIMEVRFMDTVKITRVGIPDKPMVIYIPPDGNVRLIREENAAEMILPVIDRVNVQYMGKTPYILCSFKKNIVRIEGSTYIFPGFLIMKKEGNKVDALPFEEVDRALTEFESRLLEINIGGFRMSAYSAD